MNKKLIAIVLASVMCFSGCKFRREIAVDLADMDAKGQIQEADSVYVDLGTIDKDALTEFFYGMSPEEMVEEGYAKNSELSFTSVLEKKEFSYVYRQGENDNSFVYYDMSDGAGMCYSVLLPYSFLNNEFSWRLMEMYPEDTLEDYSKEDAVEATYPIAEACGYGEGEVAVYAMTAECMREAAKFPDLATVFPEEYANFTVNPVYAPDPEYVYVGTGEISDAYKAGDYELMSELSAARNSATASGIQWSKQHEAYLLVYSSCFQGVAVDSVLRQMMCIYVPSQERVVYVTAEAPLVMKEAIEGTVLISKEEAVETALLELRLESQEDITIQNVYLVYSPEDEKAGLLCEGDRCVDPCWRIDYVINQDVMTADQYMSDDGTILVNAVDGIVTTYYDFDWH